MKRILGFISSGFCSFHSFCTGWPIPGYSYTLIHMISHHVRFEGVHRWCTYIHFLCIHFFCIDLFWYMYVSTGCRKWGECCYCNIRAPEQRTSDERTGAACQVAHRSSTPEAHRSSASYAHLREQVHKSSYCPDRTSMKSLLWF